LARERKRGAGTPVSNRDTIHSAENENGQVRSMAVQNNYVRARVPLPGLTKGKHTMKIRAMDPGAVIDRIWLP